MKKLFFGIAIVVLSISTSCSSDKATTTVAEKTATPDEKPIANKELSVEITGMVCEKGCGASIRKELLSTGGVTACSFDFEEGRESNVAKIAFDDSKISEDEIVLAITTLDEHKYTIGNPMVSDLAKKGK